MKIDKISKAIQNAGGEVFIVGGAVRDELLGIKSKDIDFLIRCLSYEEIKQSISHLGRVFDQEIGGKVSTLKAVVDGEEFDIAIPRIGEKSTGVGHGDFEITLNPHASIEEDLSRRDFTFNALAKSVDGQIVDKFGGVSDLERGLVRAVGNPIERFNEDPLRMLRALQFAARLGFEIEEETGQAIKSLKELLLSISNERIFMEFEKAWTKGRADNTKLIGLLKNLGIGEILFGKSFEPQIVKIEGDDETKVIGSFVAFFLAGGKSEAMRPTNEMSQHLNVAKRALWNAPDIWAWSKSKHLPVLIQVFSQIGKKNIVSKLEKSMILPMEPKELAVSGGEMVKLGFSGKNIGEAQRLILRKIHDNGLENTKNSLLKELEKISEQ